MSDEHDKPDLPPDEDVVEDLEAPAQLQEGVEGGAPCGIRSHHTCSDTCEITSPR